MQQLATGVNVTQYERAAVPYPPSWVDRLTAWIARRPGPAFLYYLVPAVLAYAAYLLVKWWEGEPTGNIMSRWGLFVMFAAFYYLGAIHYLDEVAQDAMQHFRPAIEASAASSGAAVQPSGRVAELEYRLTTMPPRMVWLMTLLGLGQGALTLEGMVLGILSFPGPRVFASLPATVIEVVVILIINITFVIGVYHSVHQLRTVSIIYTELTKVDLFNQEPLHAFARLAAYTAISWIVPQYFWLTVGLQGAAFTFALGIQFIIVMLGVIIFVWPLHGIHRLLAVEKEKLQGAVSKHLVQCLQAYAQALEKGDMTQMDALNKAIDNAERERRIVNAIPTWPWQPDLLRNAVTAFVLPLILWATTRILDRLLGP